MSIYQVGETVWVIQRGAYTIVNVTHKLWRGWWYEGVHPTFGNKIVFSQRDIRGYHDFPVS